MSNHVLYFSIFLVLAASTWSTSVAQDRTEETFIGNNEGVLQIEGTEQQYEYQSNIISARIDKDESTMEFIFPLNSFSPVDSDPVHEQIFNDIFASPFPLLIYMTVPFDKEALSAEDFSQPVDLVLNGVLTFRDESIQLPVEVSLFSVDENIFYNVASRFSLDDLDKPYDGIYKEIITGQFVIIINDAKWDEDLNEWR